MNRIIIIGNGFDLAHDLKTSYKDFIEWLKLETLRTHDSIGLFDYVLVPDNSDVNFHAGTNKPSAAYFFEYYKSENYKTLESFINTNKGCTFEYKNKFFKDIMDTQKFKNWVDIEEEYFNELYKCFEKSSVDHIENNYSEYAHKYVKKIKNNATIANAVESVKKLNQDFKQIKEALENYLATQAKKSISIKDNLKNSIISPFSDKDNPTKNNINNIPEALRQTLLLNFNYTSLEKLYEIPFKSSKIPYTQTIHIHGELKKEESDIENTDNPIIFGYGNTKTEKYKEIEDLNQNEFLKNMKSMLYGNKDNYKKLIDFAQLKEYQIYIWGHSCGLSDGTLLKMLFEHKNCLSIKPFYCKFKDDEGNYTGNDNYFDIRANISRHFSDQSMFLDRVMNKEDCEELK